MNVLKLLPLLVLLMLIACNQKQELNDLQIQEAPIASELDESNIDNGLSSASHRSPQESEFERYLQWVSFISARVLRYDELARGEVTNLLPGTMESIPLKKLIGANSLAPNFDTHFKDLLEFYIFIIDGNGRPQLGEDIAPTGGILESEQALEIASLSAEFLDNILNENCIELFFPNLLNFNQEFQITSTAHPLTLMRENDGFLRHYNPTSPTLGGPSILIEAVIVDEDYVNQNDNIIVARPYREISTGGSGPNCSYEEYEEIDFTLFLNF